MNGLKKVVAVAVSVACAFAIAWLSRTPTRQAEPESGVLRLSWRVLGARIEECRQRTQEELEALAPHMRTPQVCVGRNADYTLRVDLDGRTALVDTLRPAGVRADRPVYVLADLTLEPGSHEMNIAFAALGLPAERDLDDDRDADDSPVALAWAGTVTVAPGEIALITLDEAGSDLVLRGS